MVVLGSASAAGSFTNKGTVSLYADGFLPAGSYAPITDAGKGITWSGTGTYSAFGGTWDPNAHTFTVAAPTLASAGDSELLSTGQRVLVTGLAHNQRVAASFGPVTGSPSFRADWMTDGELAGLQAIAGVDSTSIPAAWDFTTPLTGQEVLLAFDIGQWDTDPQLWHLHNGAWTPYTDGTPIYSPTTGLLTVTVAEFSGYAVTVPEPTTASLLALAAAGLLARRRAKD